MKNMFLFMLLIFWASPVIAEEETLFNGGDVEYGAFSGAVLKSTSISGNSAWLVGGRCGWIVNHSFVIGGGGYGLASDIPASKEAHKIYPGRNLEMELAYGGLELEYIYRSNKLVHISLYSLIGAGNIGYGDESASNEDNDFDKKDTVFVIEPAVNGTLNATKWFRISAGISYRMISDFQLAGVDEANVSGVSGTLTFRFGKF